MPVTRLLVEGRLDAAVLGAVCRGAPVVEPRGPKHALRAIAREEQNRTGEQVRYIRDRDFDFEPAVGASPVRLDDLGWCWTRHEIENYLLDPKVVIRAFPRMNVRAYVGALKAAARAVVPYQAARWAVGLARKALPPHYELTTRPADLNELELPPFAGDVDGCRQWLREHVGAFFDRVKAALQANAVDRSFLDKMSLFSDGLVEEESKVLVWFSGKDLLSGLKSWLEQNHVGNPGAFRARLRDWVISHPDEVLTLLPEWVELLRLLRAPALAQREGDGGEGR